MNEVMLTVSLLKGGIAVVYKHEDSTYNDKSYNLHIPKATVREIGSNAEYEVTDFWFNINERVAGWKEKE